jgi:hypothetical protein
MRRIQCYQKFNYCDEYDDDDGDRDDDEYTLSQDDYDNDDESLQC